MKNLSKKVSAENIACINFLGLCGFGATIVLLIIISMMCHFLGYGEYANTILHTLQPISWTAWGWVLLGIMLTGIKEEIETAVAQ